MITSSVRSSRRFDASGSADNTAIVLWGDNGFHLGEKLHWRKFVLWEEATRVPLIFVPPGSRGGHARVHEPVSLVDIFPTILQLCAIPLPHSLDGERTSQWRLTRYVDGTEELYDHRTDPYEWTNLAHVPELNAISQELSRWIPAN